MTEITESLLTFFILVIKCFMPVVATLFLVSVFEEDNPEGLKKWVLCVGLLLYYGISLSMWFILPVVDVSTYKIIWVDENGDVYQSFSDTGFTHNEDEIELNYFVSDTEIKSHGIVTETLPQNVTYVDNYKSYIDGDGDGDDDGDYLEEIEFGDTGTILSICKEDGFGKGEYYAISGEQSYCSNQYIKNNIDIAGPK